MSPSLVLSVRNLVTEVATPEGKRAVVDDLSFDVAAGETVCIAGESGSGKTMTALSIMRLLPEPMARIGSGTISLAGRDITALSEREMRAVRGAEMAMVFQEPMTSLNPAFTVGEQIAEIILEHRKVAKEEARSRAIEMLRQVRIPSPEQRYDDYPHRLSGGMRQRAMIAMALACRPKLLICDEPTTALDVTIQAQILDLMRTLREETGTAIILITHDLGVIAELAHQVAVMYAGKVVERADVKTLFGKPRHPYTKGLFRSLPHSSKGRERLETISGVVPNPLELPTGCRFHTRCPYAVEDCKRVEPGLVQVEAGHAVACLRVERKEI